MARSGLLRTGVVLVGLASGGGMAACGPSLPSNPDAYVMPAVGDVPTRTEGPAVDAYRRVFGDRAVVYEVGPEDAESGLPAAVVAVVALDAATTGADVEARAVGPGDEVADGEIEGVKVRSTTSRQGDITLQVRLWHPTADVVVVVVGTRSPEEADAVMAAVGRKAGAIGGGDG